MVLLNAKTNLTTMGLFSSIVRTLLWLSRAISWWSLRPLSSGYAGGSAGWEELWSCAAREGTEIGVPFGKSSDRLPLKPWPLSSLIFPFEIVIFQFAILGSFWLCWSELARQGVRPRTALKRKVQWMQIDISNIGQWLFKIWQSPTNYSVWLLNSTNQQRYF